MYQPKVSVIIFTYNQEDLISETIESVLAQDYPNLEIVVADDASTDNTASVISQYEEKYPGKVVGVYNKSNLGITGNSNVAFFASTGDLVAVLGGDDLFLPGKITAQVALFSDPTVVISYHPIEIFQHQTNATLFTTNTTKNEEISDVYDLISKGGIPGASSVMVRRAACPEHGFDPSFPVVSDWIFSIEVALNGKIKELKGVYGRYRKHGFGASDRSYELLDESLRALTVISERYPDDQKMQIACQRGGYRYVLGELFRQVAKRNSSKILSLRPYLLRYSHGFRRIATNALIPAVANPVVLSLISGPLLSMKNFLKRNI